MELRGIYAGAAEEGRNMRFIFAFIAIWLWALFLVIFFEGTTSISDGVMAISFAIVAAGAMAGGGMK